jgi:hypothetical protein
MPRPTLEVADIFRRHGPAYRQAHRLPLHQHRLMRAIEDCRTPALGGAVGWCDHCHYTHIQYRSCRNRHCPKCQGLARAQWLQRRTAELLPVEYLPLPADSRAFYAALTGRDPRLCPQCRIGTMIQIEILRPCRGPDPLPVDTS